MATAKLKPAPLGPINPGLFRRRKSAPYREKRQKSYELLLVHIRRTTFAVGHDEWPTRPVVVAEEGPS
jgi:hypothetical protein